MEHLRQEALSAAHTMASHLAAYCSVQRVTLFGSVLDESAFSEESDIDIAVEGLDPERYFEALGEISMHTTFNVDLVPYEDAREFMKQRIRRGKVLYEKKQNT